MIKAPISVLLLSFFICFSGQLSAQDYFLQKHQPYASSVQSPQDYLGYGIGSQHTRHDQIVAYLKYLAEVSPRASIEEYGKTHEGRSLVILTVTNPQHLQNLAQLQEQHLNFEQAANDPDLPIFINLGYNVHGN
jgi:hypothetical protein